MKKKMMGFLLALGLILPLASTHNVNAQGFMDPNWGTGGRAEPAQTAPTSDRAAPAPAPLSAERPLMQPQITNVPGIVRPQGLEPSQLSINVTTPTHPTAITSTTTTTTPTLINDLKPLNRACLPLAGRMLKSETAACHCPPEKLCPQSIKEWEAGEGLPPSIANICCTPPKQCVFERILMQACGSPQGLDILEKDYCHTYEVKSLNVTTPEYQKFLKQITAINTKIAKIRDQMRTLSNSGDTSGAAYAQGQAMVAQIEAELANFKAIEIEVEKFNGTCDNCNLDKKIKVSCNTNGKTTFCVRRLSEACPPPPPPPGAPTGGSCRIARGSTVAYNASAEWQNRCPSPEWYDCVIRGTMVTMADGTLKPVEDVKTGDMVMGYNAVNKVMGTTMDEPDEKKLFSLNGGKIVLTGGHPILTTNGWKALHPDDVDMTESFAKELKGLKVGDEIIINAEQTMKLETIFGYTGPKATTHNLIVGGDRTFIANGVVIRAYRFGTTY